ncbi:hypothetical protein OSB04_016545 [Centaurea solstitialis]|uniref:Uncharacterized protein n=1 Tax=Centaurea solstitialis TaxID=347529 RepID=A0AA38WHJ2_9ASTR|nr:hypothetical protein OSB04_016545 [Centaurea solstitialis]
MVCGLPLEFDVVGAFINQKSLSWETARSMLQLEQHRQTARKNQMPTVLAAPTSIDRPSQNPTGAQCDQPPTHHNYSSRSASDRGRRSNGRAMEETSGDVEVEANNTGIKEINGTNRTGTLAIKESTAIRGGSMLLAMGEGTPSTNHWANHTFGPGPTPIFEPPRNIWAAYGTILPPTSSVGSSVCQLFKVQPIPSDLAHTMQQVHLNSTDPSWYMDSSTSTHLTSDPGKTSTPMSTSPVTSILSEMAMVIQFMGQVIPHTPPHLVLVT